MFYQQISLQNSENIIKNSQTSQPKAKASFNSPNIPDSIATLTLPSDTSDSHSEFESKRTVRTTCPYCGVGCGVLATIDNMTGQVSVKGDPEHPANFGKLCSKGSNLAETLGTERRLTQPYYQNKKASMQLVQSTQAARSIEPKSSANSLNQQSSDWDTVLDDVASRLSDTIAKHGPESVMFYVSGQLLTEDYYVANKLMKGFIGSNNIDSNSRLCMSSAVAGHKRAFGADLVPGSYTDFEACDLLVLVGSNMAWCHPILFGRFLQAKQENPNKKLIVIDPRRTDSCEFADLHLPIAPGTDTHLYNGLLKYLEENGCTDSEYASQCDGVEQAVTAANLWDIESVAKATQLDAEKIEQFYKLVAANDKTVTAFSMGVNQSSSGTDKVNAIINSHLLTGRVGKKGAGPFSLTGQPNAMGGREVGALANLLAGHLQLDIKEHRQSVGKFWQSPQPIAPKVGVKACDVADAILDGKVKAIWIVATNPVVSLPEANKFRQALAACDLVIVSECSKDSDTLRCADIVLPAQSWSEKSGTVTNSERRISRQRCLVSGVGDSKPDWWIFSQVAKRMGFKGFDYTEPSEIFLEHAALTSHENIKYPRQLDLMAELEKHNQPYDSMSPLQWGGQHINIIDPDFKHAKPKLVAITPPQQASAVNRFSPINDNNKTKSKAEKQTKKNTLGLGLTQNVDDGLKLRLITGRLRDQWHTMTRTALAPKLNQQQTVPTLTLHPQDAEALGVDNNDFVSIKADTTQVTECSTVVAQVEVSEDMRLGDSFMPMHWSDTFASLARVGTLIPTKVDPLSAQPELKNSVIVVQPLPIKSVGRILVHPEWLAPALVQLRQLTELTSDQSQAAVSVPNLIWSISRQQDSILINLATGTEQMSDAWLTAEFWQQFVASVVSTHQRSNSENLYSSDKLDNLDKLDKSHSPDRLDDEWAELDTSIMIYEAAQQLRYVVRQPAAIELASSSAQLEEQLMLAVYIAPQSEQLPSIHWLNSCFADLSDVPSVKWLLAGKPASGYVDPGPLVCACMGVGENTIINAITSEECDDAISVGKLCQAGTNCGSCVGQINELIKQCRSDKTVELA
ncbi:molybdopterin-dependent oxidoreductase [Psychrobacter sanguinis]|uniref:molybdopterin-dependent oxidoreductase n=1 Tax=Psychrobacter sanguinis TaxID=861445 RepID=UPI001919473A|nr:molybdopterin-dependent oxidoreductase [Psychrobacter sanguinis]MCC3307434.1 molybdopterin-dependent oxidoreductase [Psychrobacter sanguinis]